MQGWRKGLVSQTSSTLPKESSTLPKVESSVPLLFKDDDDKTVLKTDESKEKVDSLNFHTAPLQFFTTCSKLAEKCLEYFPDEKETLEPTLAMMGFINNKEVEKENIVEMGNFMLKSFYDMFSKHFDLILEKDETFFDVDNEILKSMDLKSKWLTLNETQKTDTWKDLISLVQLTNIGKMYDLCPSKMMSMISNMAQKVSQQVEKGELSMDAINPMEIGQSMVSSMSEDEIQEIGKTLMKKENLEDMMKLMQTSMKGMQNGFGGSGEGAMPMGFPKGLDLSALASLASMLK
jgi:hypothetical protein